MAHSKNQRENRLYSFELSRRRHFMQKYNKIVCTIICYYYARTSDDWAEDWMKEFNNILEENARNNS